MTHICVVKLTTIGSDNGLSPGRRQVIIWTNAGILLIGPLGTNFTEFLIGIQTFSFKKMHLKMSSAKCRPFSLGLNVLTHLSQSQMAIILLTSLSNGFYSMTSFVFWFKSHWYLLNTQQISIVLVMAWRLSLIQWGIKFYDTMCRQQVISI